MPIESFEPRSERGTEGVAEFRQLQRWLDDGGAQGAHPGLPRRPVTHSTITLSRTTHSPVPPSPVTWSPVALCARLEAERALRALPRRPWGISADGRRAIGRIVAEVEHRQLSLDAATTQLRDLTLRLHQHRLADECRHHPQEWQVLRSNASPLARRVPHVTEDGKTDRRG